jgi:hypothetical protein
MSGFCPRLTGSTFRVLRPGPGRRVRSRLSSGPAYFADGFDAHSWRTGIANSARNPGSEKPVLLTSAALGIPVSAGYAYWCRAFLPEVRCMA